MAEQSRTNKPKQNTGSEIEMPRQLKSYFLLLRMKEKTFNFLSNILKIKSQN